MSLSVGGKHLLDYWTVLLRRRWIVYLCLATICLATLVGSFLATPLYRSTTTLLIERQSPDIFTFRDLGQQSVGQDVVYVAGAALDLGAARGDLIDQLVLPGQRNAVRFVQAPLDLVVGVGTRCSRRPGVCR